VVISPLPTINYCTEEEFLGKNFWFNLRIHVAMLRSYSTDFFGENEFLKKCRKGNQKNLFFGVILKIDNNLFDLTEVS
jgi:hypothetical protein